MANAKLIQQIASELSVQEFHANNVVTLLFDEECTIPFVARYRKEKTGTMDEVGLRAIRDRYQYLVELETTRFKYLKVVEEHCKARPELATKFPSLKAKFDACTTKNELEDLYLPFKPKRRTKAQIAKEKGLEPLLGQILEQRSSLTDLTEIAAGFALGGPHAPKEGDPAANAEEALLGALDIMAERISETAELRAKVRVLSNKTGKLISKMAEGALDPKKDEAPNKAKDRIAKARKYENYFDYAEPLEAAPSHRVMAIRRAETEKVLRVSIGVDQDSITSMLEKEVIDSQPTGDAVTAFLKEAIVSAYKRLIGPSIETELRLDLRRRAEDEAIKVFAKNLSSLLLLPPIPGMIVMGVDPGLRTGSKLAVIDSTGKLLEHATIYPDLKKTEGQKTKDAKNTVAKLIKQHNVTCLAIGNGTGSREVQRVIIDAMKDAEISGVNRVTVNEAGASVYSTDPIAREEFPDLDPTIRSAVSIARRLQDPLAELVKIDPRSVGVGQYQHDVNVTKLNRSLTEVVESCVNKVGVNLNTASFKLLSYVAGIGPAVAKGIVDHRDKNGKFGGRNDLLEVAGLGPKAYQQAAGFLRVPESANPLDNSAVHPESYEIVEQMAKDLNVGIDTLVGNKEQASKISIDKYVTAAVGMPTLIDITEEMAKPGRDPREDGSRLMFSDDVSSIDDLNTEMKLQGTVTNVTNFGAFVDIGVHQDGLIHISELTHDFVKDPAEVVSVGDVIDVLVIEVDKERKRIGLSRKQVMEAPAKPAQAERPARPQQSPRNGSGPRSERSNGGSRPDRNNQNSNQEGRGRPNNSGGKGRSKTPDKTFTLDDLVSKFNSGLVKK